MKYAIGIDGGGTKTLGILADRDGRVLASASVGGTNHQICGASTAGQRLAGLAFALLEAAGVSTREIGFLCMGLAGADRREDVCLLERHLPEFLREIPHGIWNDVWIAFATGTVSEWGAVSVSGTGHNAAVRTPEGQTFGINALKFPLGNAGGGRMLTDWALHMAFRAWEHTGPETLLTRELPQACGQKDSAGIFENVYNSQYTAQYDWPVPRLVDDLACRGDPVCRELLGKLGAVQGEILAGLMHHAGLTEGKVPVVLAGSIYQKTASPVLFDDFYEKIRGVCPDAQFTVAQRPPCTGAVLMALKQMVPSAGDDLRLSWLPTLEKTLKEKEVV